ncbi:hypothetical protein [Sphingobium olei]|uniref:hypothetical protein n=1 Tax=Sphingobium olei TaxID=420955 RepID=UPI003D1B7C4B
MNDPSLLLVDEPFWVLDMPTAETLRIDLLDLWCEGRMPIQSILVVTHNIEKAVLMCDRIRLLLQSRPGGGGNHGRSAAAATDSIRRSARWLTTSMRG